jgi:hypothetical protein
MRKLTVALNLPKRDNEVIAFAKHVADSMDGNSHFPSPPVPIATLRAHIAEVDAAQIATLGGAHGTATARDAKLVVVANDLKVLRTYVETVALQHAADAAEVVASSGMSIKQSAGPVTAVFAVNQRAESGSVELVVRHPGIVSSFDWQSSTDGSHWLDAGRSVHARFTVTGLVPGTRYWFRYRVLTRDGLSDWSDPITLLVV